MQLSALTPMLRTWDLPATIEFYTQVLGFCCESFDESRGFASLRRDNAAIMLAAPNEHEADKAPAFTGSLYLKIDDVDGLWRQLQGRVRVCYPIEDFEYGIREFAIYDNNGYLLQFGQEMTHS